MKRAMIKMPVQRRSSGQKLRKAREIIRRTSIQAALSRNNSHNTRALSPPADFTFDDFALDDNIPPTALNVWDNVLQHWYSNDEPEDGPHLSSNSTATRSQTDRSNELDDISLEALSDHLGDFDLSTYGLSPDDIMDSEEIVRAAVEAHTLLEPEDNHSLSSFDLYVRFRPTESLFAELIRRYQPIDSPEGTRIPSIKQLRSLARKLSGLAAKRHHCCVNSCVAFIGYLGHMNTCPVCHESRFDSAGKPRNIFVTIPLIPQLRALFACPISAKNMQYRHTYTNNNNTIADIFDSLRYLELRNLFVLIDGKHMPYKYFQEEHEIALGLTLDGACPFKRRTNTCWPILAINYNLPSDERICTENMICVGVIPGPRCPADINSFLQPLIDELRELARGVAAVDANQEKLFSLRAHLLTIFGDIPALTKVLEFIGHNGSKNEAERKQLATESGIKGVTLFARVPSISIPRSFPVDLMHMIWQNLIPQLVELWTGDFNDLDNGLEGYQIDQDVWDALCEACIPSRRTMPTSFGCPVPDPRKRSQFIAETWSVFTTQLAPALLRKRFSDQRYYCHFVRLVKLLSLAISFDLSRDKIPEIRQGFADWIEEYEQIYYQFDEDRLQTCPVNIHYLLHVADSIEYMGPICRRYPYANIDERILNRARLQMILQKYRLADKQPFVIQNRSDESDGATIVRGYPLALLLSPHSKHLHVDRHLKRQIIRYLTTCFEILASEAEKLIPDELEQWGRLRIGNGGDTIHARGFHKLRADGRDASFVRYQLMVDQDADDVAADPRFEEESQYGQLQHVFVLTIPPKTHKVNPHSTRKRYLLLAQIYEAPVEIDETDEYKVIWYKGKLGTGEVVDVSTIQCVVGRIQDGRLWWIVDRSSDNSFAYSEFVD
ncbi:Transposase family tnp2, partial [Rhizoctonia solani]